VNDLFLGIIALAVTVMAAIQVGAIIVAARLARRVDRLATQIEQEIQPVFQHLHALTADASRAAALAAIQVERADKVFGELSQRVDQTLLTLQSRVVAPARAGFAVLAGIRAALAVLRDLRETGRRRPAAVEEEDALFIG
jgi:hypothetical protein